MSKPPISKRSDIRCLDCRCYVHPGEDYAVETPDGWLCYDSYLSRKEKFPSEWEGPIACTNCGIEMEPLKGKFLRLATGWTLCPTCERHIEVNLEKD